MADILPTYYGFLQNAADWSTAVDNFDLVSEDPESVASWNTLQRESQMAQTTLVLFVVMYSKQLLPLLLGEDCK